jgi:hypothetical protein
MLIVDLVITDILEKYKSPALYTAVLHSYGQQPPANQQPRPEG